MTGERAREVAAIGLSLVVAVRRTRRDGLALLGIMALAALISGISLAVPREIDSTLNGAARESVARAGAEADLLLQASVADASGYDTTTAARVLTLADELPERLPSALADVAGHIDTGILGPEIAGVGPNGAAQVRIGVIAPSAISQLRLVEGTLPAGDAPQAVDASAPLDAAVSRAAASAAGVSLGSTLTLRDAGSGPDKALTIRVAAITDPVDADASAWQDLPGTWNPQSVPARDGSPSVAFTVLTDASAFDRVSVNFPDASIGTIRTTFDPAQFTLQRFETVRAAIDELETSTAALTQGAALSINARSGYEEALAGFPAAVSAATAQLSTIAAGVLGVAVLVSVLASSALARRRSAEVALIRSRGASLGLIAAHATVESLFVTLLGTAIGAAAISLSGGLPRSPVLIVTALAVIVAAPIVGTLRPLLPAMSQARAAALRFTAIGVLLATAIAALVALRAGSTGDAAGIDPLALVAPVLCAAVVALAFAPLSVTLVRPLSRLASRTRGTGVLLAGSSAQEGRSLLTLVAVVLATSAAITSLVLLQTVAQGQQSASWRAVGADVRIDRGAGGELDADALVTALRDGGATATAEVAQLDRIEATGDSSSVSATVLAVDRGYAALVSRLPLDDPQQASHTSLARLSTVDASAGSTTRQPIPVVIDSRLATTTGTGEFTLDIDGVTVPVSVVASPAAGPGYIAGPVVILDRERLLAYLADQPPRDSAEPKGEAPVTTILAIGTGLGGAASAAVATPSDATAEPAALLVLRDDVLDSQRDAALISGVTAATRQSLLATAALATLALMVTTVLGVRRRGRTQALLSALGVPRRSSLSLAVGELAPLVVSGIVGGALAASVVLVAAGSAFDIDTLVGASAAISAPAWLAAAVLGAGAAALGLCIAIDLPLTGRVKTADILRTGEES